MGQGSGGESRCSRFLSWCPTRLMFSTFLGHDTATPVPIWKILVSSTALATNPYLQGTSQSVHLYVHAVLLGENCPIEPKTVHRLARWSKIQYFVWLSQLILSSLWCEGPSSDCEHIHTKDRDRSKIVCCKLWHMSILFYGQSFHTSVEVTGSEWQEFGLE